MPPRAKVPCKCVSSSCYQKEYRDEFGQVQKGHLVASSTRIKHEATDKRLGLDPHNPSLQANVTPTGPRKTSTEPPSSEAALPGRKREERGTDIGSSAGSTSTVAAQRQSIYTLVCMLATWLHIKAGLSRASTNVLLRIVSILVAMAINLGYLAAYYALDAYELPSTPGTPLSINLPNDVRTATAALFIEPTLERAVCCPKCMSRYKLSNLPERCYHRASSRSRMCNEPLWTTRTTRQGPRKVPRQLYTTQDPDSWIQFLLSCPNTEDWIQQSWDHVANPQWMKSIWDSPAWKSLGNFTTTPGNLTFSYYIDWFNPLTNKIAGKTVSCGAIMFFCLNLPYELQHLPEYTFFAGITPPPHEPSVTGITNLLDPIMERFDYLYRVGKTFRTFKYPEGRHIRVAVLPAIGDLLAMRKALGFAGVASNKHFCSFCKLHKDNIEELDTSKFVPRNGPEATAAAQKWHDAPTKAEKAGAFKESGLRWTSLHLLSYRDPVKHTILGMMHNWIEGVLQHHARVMWGIGVTKAPGKNPTKQGPANQDPSYSASASSDDSWPSFDMSSLDEEIDALYQDMRQHGNDIMDGRRGYSDQDVRMQDGAVLGDDDGMEMDEDDLDDEDEGGDADEETVEEGSRPSPQVFTAAELGFIREGLSDIVVPSYLARLPSNFGEASHGKLKADQWLVAFSVYFPLILPELWHTDGTQRKLALLDNLEHLVTCTNIICAHSVSDADADKYMHHYIEYRRSARDLFAQSNSRPNHHYAMHNGDMMKFWGPLIQLSEFRYESHNGTLQKIKTNSHPWELDLTMLRSICRRGRLEAMFHEGPSLGSLAGSLFSSALQVLRSTTGTAANSTRTEMDQNDEVFNGSGKPLEETTYAAILSYLQAHHATATYRHHDQVPHPMGANVLTNYAQSIKHFEWKTREYSTYAMHAGNGSISYRSGDGKSIGAGFIQEIVQQSLEGQIRTFLVINPHQPLSPTDQLRNPYASRPGFLATLAYDLPCPSQYRLVIEPDCRERRT